MDKLKIEHALSNLMDDLADIESAYGKNLTKVRVFISVHAFTCSLYFMI